MNMDNVDQHLLHQFSCLGTTDRDDLVKQLQKLLAGSQLNETTAEFFLDMNNWNLQAAICSYFDFESPVQHKFPCMMLISDSTIGEGESIPPLTNFRKSWHIQNSGREAWPDGVCLQYIGGVQMGECTKIPVPSLGPGEITEVSVDLQSPPHCGTFQSKWRMMVKSTEILFGDIIWITITVSESGTLAITQQLHQLSTSSSNDTRMC
ncbi:protein ILRUN [Bombus vosnesenskii]|uniref:Protein ILRUN n=2 Tax=Pyrobombus TaxID=144703 RepID=A0A6J3LGV7_9HYME|nr:protein ILRUN [Bombus impatiens]XP_012240837.1 protein ILRUN [Bombus impatiens]XP_033364793.1 protein ILRUN [Bombus vosnesenskii]XP_033364794.1 protein ILRUN [Bombus vosnesenskii]XP_050493204.1 protein ILRUN [Bombus huntii]